MDYLRDKGEVSVNELAKLFNISAATIRRDLAILNKEEMVVRSFGGVTISEGFSVLMRLFDVRLEENVENKMKIAKRICQDIPAGSTIALDGGTSCYYIARELKNRPNLRFVTNSLKIAEILSSTEKNDVILVGGDYRSRNYDCIGTRTVSFIETLHMDIAILSPDFYKEDFGFFYYSCHSADIANAMNRFSGRVFVVCDDTKFETNANFRGMSCKDVDTLYFAGDPDPDILENIASKTFNLVIC